MQFGGRVFSHEDHELLERIANQVDANAQALADLQASVNALAATPVPSGATDISAGVETEVGKINAVTTALGGTPPAPPTPSPAPAVAEPAPAEATASPAVATPTEDEHGNPIPNPNPPA